jgi:hypothetical protein
MNGRHNVTGQPLPPTCNEPSKQDPCSGTNRTIALADQMRTRRYTGRSTSQPDALPACSLGAVSPIVNCALTVDRRSSELGQAAALAAFGAFGRTTALNLRVIADGTRVGTGTDACSRRGRLSILVTCWNCGRTANAATGISTRHRRTCLSVLTSAPGAATARRTSCTASARTAAASLSGDPSARPACSQSTRHRPNGSSGQDALCHPPADPLGGEQEPSRPDPQAPPRLTALGTEV